LVSGAVFSDLDADGDPDLILACEWGPLKVFRNDRGEFDDATKAYGLSEYVGWWNGVTTGDFDADGRLDIVASNWGCNTKYEMHRHHPAQIYYGDFSGRGTVDIIEAYFEPELDKTVPARQLDVMGDALPHLRERFRTHRAYAVASVEDLLGERMSAAQVHNATWLESTVFVNRGDRFEARVLPDEAQWSPAFGVCVGDADGDGHEDVFLAQNFFATATDTPRYDAGRGLWLRGDGRGGFVALSGQRSGIKVYGEQRGAALADYDGDGRVDLAVSQNAASTKLYRNQGARPGLIVSLRGPDPNPNGVGAAMRLWFGGRPGPVREIHAGSGYWSQDSAAQVLATPETPTKIWVRWPGGKTVTLDLPEDVRRVTVEHEGGLRIEPH
jgi:hypothetical protein